MASLKTSIQHQLPKEEAVTRIRQLLSDTRKQHAGMVENLKEDWEGNTGKFSFTAKGFDVAGTLTVRDSTVELDGTIPFALSFFKGKIVQVIKDRAESLLRK
jgi:hypothetical protein